jgi:GNAT superfamily N-acetyltransferase
LITRIINTAAGECNWKEMLENTRLSTTVTFLEMFDPPENLLAESPPITLNLVQGPDLSPNQYREILYKIGREWHWVDILRLSDQQLRTRLDNRDREIQLLEKDGCLAGFFEIRHVLPRRAELEYFGLCANMIGKGVGRWFLGQALRACWSRNPARVVTRTCTLDHPAALPLYLSCGFCAFSVQEDHVRPLSVAEHDRLFPASH